MAAMAFGFEEPASGLIVDRDPVPDRQHRFALDFARAYADDVTVVVGAAAGLEEIAESVQGRGYDLLFATDPGDRLLAAAIGARCVPCFPLPATRHARGPSPDPFAPRPDVRVPLKRVCVFGPESSGKTTLANQLARHYKTVYAPEYVRDYLDPLGGIATAQDMPWIARGQRATEIAGAAQADPILICDTNLATIVLWNDILFGATPGWMRDEAARQTYDLWLLTDIDVPFEPDPQRCFPEPAQRAWLMRECVATLERLGIEPVLVRGSPAARLAIACAAIDRVLAQ
jgi:nicotinamide riboside kinase